MNELLAGALVMRGSDGGRLTSVLAREARCRPGTQLLEHGPLRVLWRGSPPRDEAALCLFDGCLDNAEELSLELGCPPYTPIERLLAVAYRRWEEALPARLRGDFALLIWDRERDRGLLARDQLGVRSLYLHRAGGALCFATELRELLAILPTRPPPDPRGVVHWLAARPQPGPGTLYAGVQRVQPAGLLRLSPEAIEERRYWTPAFAEPARTSASEAAAHVREALGRAVARRMSPAVTGVLMSGGLDSATVAALAARESRGSVLACSALFPEHPDVDESELIAVLRASLRLEGIGAEVRSGGLLASALESLREWQLPPLSWGEFWARPLLDGAARAGAEVMLGGDGGDELFATRARLLADRMAERRPRAVLELARELPGAGAAPSRVALARAVASLGLGGALPERARRIAGHLRAVRVAPSWLLPGARRELRFEPEAARLLAGPRWWREGAATLAFGIEGAGVFELHRHRAASAGLLARHPLFDLELVELVLSQAPETSFDRHRNRPLLRAAVGDMLPEPVRTRTAKARFDSLVAGTLAGPDARAVRALLCDPSAELRRYVDLARAERMLLCAAPTAETQFAWMQQVWRLTTAECWLRTQCADGADSLAALIGPSAPRVRLLPFSALTSGASTLGCSASTSPRKEGTWRSTTPTRSLS